MDVLAYDPHGRGTVLLEDNSGVNIIIEYVMMLVIMLVLFSIMMSMISDTSNKADNIAYTQEFGTIANSIANHYSEFTSELYIDGQPGTNSTSTVQGRTLYFDLPQLVQGKQYIINVTYDGAQQSGDVVVTYASNSNIYSKASFKAMRPVANTTIYSQPGRYGLFYDNNTSQVELRCSL